MIHAMDLRFIYIAGHDYQVISEAILGQILQESVTIEKIKRHKVGCPDIRANLWLKPTE